MSKSALFIVDHVRGMGHVVRSRALANALTERGWLVSACSKRPPGFNGDVVIVDGNHFESDAYDWRCPVVAIQDKHYQGSTLWPPGGLTLHVHASAKFINARTGIRPVCLQGPTFSLLRREFLEVQWDPMMDVSDLRAIKDASVFQMSILMARSAVVVTYAGMRAMEAACVGTPTVLVARNEGELWNAEGLAAVGAAKHISEEDQVIPMVRRLLESPRARLQRMSRIAQQHVDGRGCERVADAIEEEIGR